jgi:hypothetical protein
MRITLTHAAPRLVAGAVIPTLVAAPTAAAAATPLEKNCVASGTGITCQAPGNAEITNSVPPVGFHPYGDMPYLLGGH